jgi:hypothetical protein
LVRLSRWPVRSVDSAGGGKVIASPLNCLVREAGKDLQVDLVLRYLEKVEPGAGETRSRALLLPRPLGHPPLGDDERI